VLKLKLNISREPLFICSGEILTHFFKFTIKCAIILSKKWVDVRLKVVAIFIVFASLFFINGCSSVRYNTLYTQKDNIKIDKLKSMLIGLGGKKRESSELATLAVTHSKGLANRYNLVSPPLYHNYLVNSGQREKGLCYDFVDDLMVEINSRNFKSFDFKWGRANANKLDEHNVIVVVKKGSSDFQNGIILDAWRNSGKVLFLKLKDDPKYRFKEWLPGNKRIAR